MIVGIDLGTTHSLIGAYSEQGSTLFRNALGDHLTPSVVSVDGDTVLVGQAARDRLISHPHHTVASFKRWMGTARETRLGDRSFRPEELSALVLRSLLADAEAALGEKIEEAVISVPAYFSDAQRKATRTAGELAGVRVERLINEPTAAALAYGLQTREEESRFLVFDLGGGTFDVSILECFDNVFEVHASAGDNFLGGEDFLELLVDAFCSEQQLRVAALPASELGQLRRRLEQLKRDLSGKHEVSIEIALSGRVYAACGPTSTRTVSKPCTKRIKPRSMRFMIKQFAQTMLNGIPKAEFWLLQMLLLILSQKLGREQFATHLVQLTTNVRWAITYILRRVPFYVAT